MGQLLVRQVDDADIARLKERARASGTSVEALAREAIRQAAKLTVDERRALAGRFQAETQRSAMQGVDQTPGWLLVREDRDAR